MIRVGVIGYGYWGPNLVRNFAETPGCQVAAISDLDQNRLGIVQSRYPTVRVTTDYRQLLADDGIDAVAVATPVSTHFDIAMQALQMGKHVLVEKPLAASSEQGLVLTEESKRRKRVLMVGHTFVYTGAVRKIRDFVSDHKLGEIYYYDSVRINLGRFQHDVNVIWDLAVHDFSILEYVLPLRPRAVSATGIGHIAGQPQDIAYITLFFDSPLVAHVHVNWLAPVKVRRTLIGGSTRMIVYDDLEPSEKIKVYEKGITLENHAEDRYRKLIGYRTGDMMAPHLDLTEGLRTEVAHFIRCVQKQEAPETDGGAGVRVVRILEAATRSMEERGRLVELPRE